MRWGVRVLEAGELVRACFKLMPGEIRHPPFDSRTYLCHYSTLSSRSFPLWCGFNSAFCGNTQVNAWTLNVYRTPKQNVNLSGFRYLTGNSLLGHFPQNRFTFF